MSTSPGRDAWRMMLELLFSGKAHGRMEAVCSAVGVSPGILKTLFHLEPGLGVPMRNLADQWQCDASYVTGLVDALEERGLAARRPHPTDRRVKMIVLTDHGVATKKRAFELLYEPPPSFGALTDTEQRHLRDLLQKISDAEQAVVDRPAAAAR
jgi:DNA-binding MarR family transcriptional regulator